MKYFNHPITGLEKTFCIRWKLCSPVEKRMGGLEKYGGPENSIHSDTLNTYRLGSDPC